MCFNVCTPITESVLFYYKYRKKNRHAVAHAYALPYYPYWSACFPPTQKQAV